MNESATEQMYQAPKGASVVARRDVRSLQSGDQAVVTITVDPYCPQCTGTGLIVTNMGAFPSRGGAVINFDVMACGCIGIRAVGNLIPQNPAPPPQPAAPPITDKQLSVWKKTLDAMAGCIAAMQDELPDAPPPKERDHA